MELNADFQVAILQQSITGKKIFQGTKTPKNGPKWTKITILPHNFLKMP